MASHLEEVDDSETSKMPFQRSVVIPGTVRDKVKMNLLDIAQLMTQLVKGSGSTETLSATAKMFSSTCDTTLTNTFANLKKLEATTHQLRFQADAVERSLQVTDDIVDKLVTIQRQHCF